MELKNIPVIKMPLNQNETHEYVNKVCKELDDFLIDDLYDVLTKNGWYLPLRSNWVTKRLMLQFWRGDTFCPMYSELKPRPCPHHPPR